MAKTTKHDDDLLTAALIGYAVIAADIDSKMEDIRQQLRGSAPVEEKAKKTHRISAAGRARIAAAQKRRWAAKKGQTAGA